MVVPNFIPGARSNTTSSPNVSTIVESLVISSASESPLSPSLMVNHDSKQHSYVKSVQKNSKLPLPITSKGSSSKFDSIPSTPVFVDHTYVNSPVVPVVYVQFVGKLDWKYNFTS